MSRIKDVAEALILISGVISSLHESDRDAVIAFVLKVFSEDKEKPLVAIGATRKPVRTNRSRALSSLSMLGEASVREIAIDAGMDKKIVRQTINELCQKRVVKRVRRGVYQVAAAK